MKIGIYGIKAIIEKLEDRISKVLEKYPIAKAEIYLKDNISPVCLDCLYFPCCKEEVCTEKKY